MTPFEASLLSFIQGATEFLPVSSSGHLVLAQELLGTQEGENVAFAVLVHFGTLLAIVAAFRGRLLGLVRFASIEAAGRWRREGFRKTWLEDREGRMIAAILLATLVTAIIGLSCRRFFEALYEMPDKVGWALCVTAALLGTTLLRRKREPESDTEQGVDACFPFRIALVIGFVQAMAIIPGISRSGSTIAIALLLGLRPRQAFEFSFLIAVPAIAGAVVLELPKLADSPAGLSLAVGLFSLAVAALSGWFFLKATRRFVLLGQFGYFGVYCLAVGVWAILHFS